MFLPLMYVSKILCYVQIIENIWMQNYVIILHSSIFHKETVYNVNVNDLMSLLEIIE